MKYAIVAFLGLASIVTSVAVAQDGAGGGPPKTSVVFVNQHPASASPAKAPAPTVSRLKLQ